VAGSVTKKAARGTLMVRGRVNLAMALVGIAGFLPAIPLVLGFLGSWHPAFDSMSHFRLHFAAAMVVAGLVLLASPTWRTNGMLMIVLAAFAGGVTLWPAWQAGRAVAAHSEAGARYRLIQLNLRFDNPRPETVIGKLTRERPDLVTLEEVSARWVAHLAEALQNEFPYRLVCPTHSYLGGIALLSRHPLRYGPDACRRADRFVTAAVELDGRAIQIAAVHLGWPWPFGQDRQVARLVPTLARMDDDALLAGDFNAAPWSRTVRAIAQAGELSLGPWAGPGYLDRRLPAWLRPLAGLPIDHAMSKGIVTIDDVRRLDFVGSDHLPLMVKFHLEASGNLPPADASLASLSQ